MIVQRSALHLTARGRYLLRVRAAFLPARTLAACERLDEPFRPPLLEDERFSLLPRPDPLFFPP